MKIDGRQLHHLRFVDDIVIITPDISQAERRLNGVKMSECPSYIYLGRGINMLNDLAPKLSRRKRVAWGAFKSIEDVVKKTKNTRLRAHLFDLTAFPALTNEPQTGGLPAFKSIEDVVKRTKNTRLRAHLFDSTVLPALTHASGTWSLCKLGERPLSVIERAVERTMLGVSRFIQVRDWIRSSDLRQRSKIKDIVLYAKQSKIVGQTQLLEESDIHGLEEFLMNVEDERTREAVVELLEAKQMENEKQVEMRMRRIISQLPNDVLKQLFDIYKQTFPH
uniref:Reverse transcriptase domain-containing protein n=1 Tax=Angiostrongylus cantonensis TaxID=6313 RepID=A0A0K0DDB8_ANGCA